MDSSSIAGVTPTRPSTDQTGSNPEISQRLLTLSRLGQQCDGGILGRLERFGGRGLRVMHRGVLPLEVAPPPAIASISARPGSTPYTSIRRQAVRRVSVAGSFCSPSSTSAVRSIAGTSSPSGATASTSTELSCAGEPSGGASATPTLPRLFNVITARTPRSRPSRRVQSFCMVKRIRHVRGCCCSMPQRHST